jgi:hypothetical protein
MTRNIIGLALVGLLTVASAAVQAEPIPMERPITLDHAVVWLGRHLDGGGFRLVPVTAPAEPGVTLASSGDLLSPARLWPFWPVDPVDAETSILIRATPQTTITKPSFCMTALMPGVTTMIPSGWLPSCEAMKDFGFSFSITTTVVGLSTFTGAFVGTLVGGPLVGTMAGASAGGLVGGLIGAAGGMVMNPYVIEATYPLVFDRLPIPEAIDAGRWVGELVAMPLGASAGASMGQSIFFNLRYPTPKVYYREAKASTRATIRNHGNEIDPKGVRGKGYDIDHKVSIKQGYLYKIDPSRIAHKDNLHLMPTARNRSLGAKLNHPPKWPVMCETGLLTWMSACLYVPAPAAVSARMTPHSAAASAATPGLAAVCRLGELPGMASCSAAMVQTMERQLTIAE